MFESCLSNNPKTRSIQIALLKKKIHSPFTTAVATNNLARVDELIGTLSEEELNWQGAYGNTALHWAVANTHSRMALKLLEHTPRINVNILDDEQKKTALHLAVAKGWDHFDDDNFSPEELPQAAIIKELAKKADLNIQDANGNTPLHIAVMRRDVECIRLFLNSGAHQDIRNQMEQTPLELLNMDFHEVQDFIHKYASVYTLAMTTWENNKDSVLALFESKQENPIASFNQAIGALENFLANEANFAVRPSVIRFLFEIKNLQMKVGDLLLDQEIDADDAKKLANAVLILSQKIVNATITETDVHVFSHATETYRKTSTLSEILGATLGAIIGLALGIALGLIAGPIIGAYAGIKGAMVGASIGAAFGFWVTKKASEQHPLSKLESTAVEHIQCLRDSNYSR